MSEPAAFHALVGNLDSQMVVVTTRAGDGSGEISGCLVGFLTQCSINPARVLVCLSDKNHTFRVAERQAEIFVVHVLHRMDATIARHFGELTGDEVDKFANVPWTPGPGGVPVVDGLDWFAGRVRERHRLGDHVGFLLDALDEGSAARVEEPPLGLMFARQFEPGHEA